MFSEQKIARFLAALRIATKTGTICVGLVITGNAVAIPISATLRPPSFLFDSLVFRTAIAVVWLPSLLADLRRISIQARGAFIRYLWRVDRSVGQMLLIRNRSKQTAC